jgi:hypothetical protein
MHIRTLVFWVPALLVTGHLRTHAPPEPGRSRQGLSGGQ